MSESTRRPTAAGLLEQVRSRRAFLKSAAVAVGTTAAASTVLTACQGNEAKASTAAAGGEHAGMAGAAAAATPVDPRAKADAMDRMHEAGMKAFPARTAKLGNQVLAPRTVDGVTVFDLTAREMKWETEPGKFVNALAYNEQVPGPPIRVREGDRVRINLRNELGESTPIHFHGLELPNDQDGVTFITQPTSRQASGGTSSSRRTTRARGRSTATSSRTRQESAGCSAWSGR